MNRKTVISSVIVLYFIIGFEILIMISPFAGLFFSAFTPFLLVLTKYTATRWLCAFYLPHMVVPPDNFLKFVRVMGSVLFVSGIIIFIICALQVYTNKFLKKGTALKGLYSIIRHPQYVGLISAGIGLSILWPRFLTIVLWLIMIVLYYFLSKDEERRMLSQHPDSYKDYMEKTGMFLPKIIERQIAPSSIIGKSVLFVFISVFTISSVFYLRFYTIRHLPLWTSLNFTVFTLMPDDTQKVENRMNEVLLMPEIKAQLKDNTMYLVYFIPVDYIMQGLIADTGEQWRLYHRHMTFSRFFDWVIHPFSHLEGHCSMDMNKGDAMDTSNGVVRRLIFIDISGISIRSPYDLFSINAQRSPQFMADVDIHNLKIIDIKNLSQDTGWGKLPTPSF
ncbi:MAG: isoprenylcysteine carboxylmethyltransferase family protein [Nitrospirae bacterium]|nr:isoprenylcysteine carboxylmethyltransferase family protein [Nitrospirota bacterium]